MLFFLLYQKNKKKGLFFGQCQKAMRVKMLVGRHLKFIGNRPKGITLKMEKQEHLGRSD